MLKFFFILLILGISQSLSALSNNQQDLVIRPIVYKQLSHQYLAEAQNQQTIQHQYQPSFVQNSLAPNYNGPSYQYLPSLPREEVSTTPSPNLHTSHQGVSLSQYQPSFAQNALPLNNNRPPLSPKEVTTTPRSSISTPPAIYQGPAYQYSPATTETTQTATTLPSASHTQNSDNSNNYPFNHNNHWNPINNQRFPPTSTNNLPLNVQPPIELHHGYRYIEPAQKVNNTNFQPINGVIYNELGLGQNETNTTQKPQTFVVQNPTNKTEFQTQQGYVYGNTQYSQHFPNTTVLRPVPTQTSSNNYYNPNQNFNNEFENQKQNSNPQQAIQQKQESHITSPTLEQPTTLQYQNHRYSNSNLNTPQRYQPIRAENNPSATTSTNNRPIDQTSQHSQTENKPAITSTNNRPTIQTNFNSINPQTSSHSNEVNLLSNSNNIASPQLGTNGFITEVSQQMATQIYPNLHIPNQISSSNTKPSIQSEYNQYFLTPSQQSAQDALQIRPSNYGSFNRAPLEASSTNNIENIQTQSNRLGTLENQQPLPTTYPPHHNQQNIFKPPQPSAVFNYILNVPSHSNRYDSTTLATNPSNQNQQIIDSNYDYYSTNTQQPPHVAQLKPNVQADLNHYVSTSISTQPSNPNLQNIEPNQYYSTNSPQFSQTSNVTPNIPTQSNRYNTDAAAGQQPTYSSNQNQQNSATRPPHTSSLNFIPNDQPIRQESNTIPQTSISFNIRPNTQTQSNQYHSSSYNQQQPQNAYFSNPNILAKPTQKPSFNFVNNIQNESKRYYYTNPLQQSNTSPAYSITSNTKPKIQTESNRFFPNTPQQSQQSFYPSKQIDSQFNNLPAIPTESATALINTQNDQTQSNRVNFDPQQLVSNSKNPSSSQVETPRYTPARQNLYQSQQYFLTKPAQASQVTSANTVSNFFGETSAVSTTTPISENSNGNIITPTTKHQPVNLMGNSNYLQMQSHSFEMPYYYTMMSTSKQPQQNYVATMQESQKPLQAPVEPVRLPHLSYGTPLSDASNTHVPPSISMHPPYYKK